METPAYGCDFLVGAFWGRVIIYYVIDVVHYSVLEEGTMANAETCSSGNNYMFVTNMSGCLYLHSQM